jgi:ribonuclease HII
MIGIDEVGRGAWAGPLVVAGCYFIENPGFVRGLNDSKKLSRRQREELDDQIKSSTLFEIAFISAELVDELGLTACMRMAILQILEKLPTNEEILIDGKFNFLKGTPYEALTSVEIGADGKYVSVMAASVIAKVARDKIMDAYDKEYPNYGFSKHVGYGTALHAKALKDYGPCPIHRKSFRPIKELQ